MRLNQLTVLIAVLCIPFSFAFTRSGSMPHAVSAEYELANKVYRDLFVDLSEAELENKILAVTNLFEPKFTSEVKSYLRVYLTSRPQWTQVLLGRTSIYFPIFERKIEEKGLPNDIKFISIIESALRTEARSRVGAQGLWQFMPGTAKMNQLVIDQYVDEREDPYRATDAALEYLNELHGKYKDWALAIAAYNSGPGRVNQAIAISGSRNFWKLRNYLPKETRNYVPAFLAAAFMIKHYAEYYLVPETPSLDFQITKAIKIYDQLGFKKISDLTGMAIEDIRFLNTSYRKDFIPSNKVGYTLLLPSRFMPMVENYVNNLEKKETALPQIAKAEIVDSSLIDELFYDHVLYEAQQGEKLAEIAEWFNVDKYNIRHWNGMHSDEIAANKPLLIHYIKSDHKISIIGNVRKFIKRPKLQVHKINTVVQPLNRKDHNGLGSFYNKVDSYQSPFENLDLNNHYRLRRGESLQDALRKMPDLSMEDIKITADTRRTTGIVLPLAF